MEQHKLMESHGVIEHVSFTVFEINFESTVFTWYSVAALFVFLCFSCGTCMYLGAALICGQHSLKNHNICKCQLANDENKI